MVKRSVNATIPIILGLNSVFFLVNLGMMTNRIQTSVVEFFVQSEQVDKNADQIKLLQEENEILKRHINNLYKAS